MATAAERQKRYRRHKAGDHSLCLVVSCRDAPATPGETPVTRGQRLWRDLKGDEFPPAQRLLLEEACRIADRLDQLDRLLGDDGETWLRILRGDPERQTLVIDKALSEARQQATALKQLISEIRAAGVAQNGQKPAAVAGKEVPAGVTDLATWTPGRSAKSTG